MNLSLHLKKTLQTVAIVGLTTFANYLLNKLLGIDSPMLAFCLGITCAAWLGGFWQGVFATLLSFVAVIWVFSNSSLMAAQQMWAIRCVLFCANGILTSLLCGKLRDSRERLAETAELLRNERSHETRRALDELRASRAFLDSIIENIPAMVFVKEAKTLKFVRWNRAGAKLIGREPDELIGKTDHDFFPIEQADFFVAADREVLKGRHLVDIPEEPLRNARGEELLLHTKKIPVYGADGEPEFLLGISEDVTEARKREQQRMELAEAKAAKAEAERLSSRMQELADAASEASRAKSAFMANISHEIRTPLGAMIGFAELSLEDGNLTQDHVQKLKTIERNGRQLLRIVNEILDLSKVESEHVQIENTNFNLFSVVEDVRELLTITAQEKSLRLSVDFVPPHDTCIYSDPNRLRQILINMVGNAVKFTTTGEVRLKVSLKPIETTSSILEIIVTDSGVGLNSDQAARLFKPFAQADESMTRRFGGTGLGLFLSRKLANLMGGDVSLVESTPGEGSVFKIDLAVKVVDTISSRPTSAASELAPKNSLNGMRVLLVDDAPDNRSLLQTYLKKWDIDVAAESNGCDGVKAAMRDDFDVILLDIQMPEMDGFQAIRLLREKNYSRPVIALTAHAMKGDREKCLEAGFDDYLQKPVDRKALEATLRRYRR